MNYILFHKISKFNLISNSMLRLIFIYLLLNFIHISLVKIVDDKIIKLNGILQIHFFNQNHLYLMYVLVIQLIFFVHIIINRLSMEYNTLYLVSEIDYNLCFTKNYQPLIRCDQPYNSKRLIYTLSISKYLPYPNMPEFLDGHSYYFISTSNGQKTGINQKYDGLCRTKNFRLIVDVQKYYRRYSKIENSQYRMKIQKQLS